MSPLLAQIGRAGRRQGRTPLRCPLMIQSGHLRTKTTARELSGSIEQAAAKGPGRLLIVAVCGLGSLRLKDRDDFVRPRINDENLVAYHDVLIAAPFGVNHEYFLRQRIEVDTVGNAGSHARRDVKML